MNHPLTRFPAHEALAGYLSQITDAHHLRIQVFNHAFEEDRLKEWRLHPPQMLVEEFTELAGVAAKMATELKEAKENIECWAAYASEHIRKNHGLEEDTARIDKMLSKYQKLIGE